MQTPKEVRGELTKSAYQLQYKALQLPQHQEKQKHNSLGSISAMVCIDARLFRVPC